MEIKFLGTALTAKEYKELLQLACLHVNFEEETQQVVFRLSYEPKQFKTEEVRRPAADLAAVFTFSQTN